MHIVHFIKPDQLPACGTPGCPVVLGVLFALTRNESLVTPALRTIIEAMPLTEGKNNTIEGTFDVDALLPQNRAYFTYEVRAPRILEAAQNKHKKTVVEAETIPQLVYTICRQMQWYCRVMFKPVQLRQLCITPVPRAARASISCSA
jgi:carbonic anhydrase